MASAVLKERGVWVFTAIGTVLGLGAPVGWLLLRTVALHWDVIDQWFAEEVAGTPTLYLYLTVATVTAFAIFGLVVGLKADRIRRDWESTKAALNATASVAIHDELTGLFNIHYLRERIPVELESARRFETSVACLILDIDHFKNVNDRYGHLVGDSVLRSVATAIQDSVRSIDIVGRYGGEEFLIIMPHTKAAAAAIVAERIRKAVERLDLGHPHENLWLTISGGVSAFPGPQVSDMNTLLKKADDSLYEAKRTGRNRVVRMVE
jgi:diguanylate cyclase (GGDEF)-like protein